MTETIGARLHRIIGGWICVVRGTHRLVLAEESHLGGGGSINLATRRIVSPTQTSRERRPFCATCWQCPGD